MSTRTFRCEGALAKLDFTVEIPHDWQPIDLPREDVDFDDATKFAPLTVLMAPYAAILFTVAARPAYASGTVAQWLQFVAREHGADLGALETQQLGTLAGVGAWGMQQNDGTVLRARLLFVEDGDRLLYVSCLAPNELWNAAAPAFARMLATFTLQDVRGSKVALAPADLPLAANTMQAPERAQPAGANEAAAATAAAAAAQGPLPMPGFEPDVEPPVLAMTCALAKDMATFDAEHAFNVTLRDRGAGLVPNVLDYHEQELWATLAPAALRATLRVPFGWHVLDDGKRTLVFDAAGHTQVNLQLCWREGQSDAEILQAKLPELQREWPQLRHLRTEVLGLQALLIKDATVNGQAVEQAYILRDAFDGLVLQVRVTSSPAHAERAGQLAEVLLRDLQFPGAPGAVSGE